MTTGEGDLRARIVTAALHLLTEGGVEAVSTRAVSAAAGTQPPTIYRFFGDMQQLLDAVAVRGFEDYLAAKTRPEPAADPVENLRRGWDLHVDFGLANPAVYRLMYARLRTTEQRSPALAATTDVLAQHIHRIAVAGRLRVPEARAAALVHAAGSGTTLSLIATPPPERDPDLSPTAREAVIAAITTEGAAATPGPGAAAITLRASLDDLDRLSAGEKALLAEWLDRVAR
ncbi:TetR/AcrR family transcriptional regulator [Actinokineospora bangkokensis]|uniref:TetR family transcriptional regulator n=1 Tax=Actinokineospora bangkokensis TaxID=1193682 RepID=A0A1Q9LK51_9PSEU|nr:TetR/AcrR family transcriptional regulator [Actinokineospora bangkokensis]OLR92408.1 TetR family transcriptional regulator [Actinokineospora bangkokensis]